MFFFMVIFSGTGKVEEADADCELQPAVCQGRPQESVLLPAGEEGRVLWELPHQRDEIGNREAEEGDDG